MFLVLFAAPLAAQSLTGMYEGTFTLFIDLPPGCTNITSFSYSGSMHGSLTQSGNKLTGTFLLNNPTVVNNKDGVCSGAPWGPWDSMTTVVNGSLSGSSVSGDFIMFGVNPPFQGTVSGSALSVHGKNSGRGISFEIARTSTTTLPSISFDYARSGAATGIANLFWSTAGATSVVITWAGTRPLFGELATVPNATRTEKLTATGPSGTAVKTFILKTAMTEAADVVVSISPQGILQRAGSPLPSDSFTLTNIGGTATDITLTSSPLFTLTPSSFRLEPIESTVVTVVAATHDSGSVHGSVAISGDGVNAGLSIPLHRLVADAPPASVLITSGIRRDLNAPQESSSAGAVSFTNTGGSTVQGVVIADVPWISIQSPDLTLGPGETKQVQVSVDRSLRQVLPNSGASGGISFRYINASTISSVPVAIFDVVDQTSFPFSSSNMSPAETVPIFAPGVSANPASFSDLVLSNRQTSELDLSMILFPSGSSSGGMLPQTGARIPAHASTSFPGVAKSSFGQIPGGGTLLFRHPNVAVSHTRINTKGGASTVTALPVFRPGDGYAAGADLFLTGVKKSATLSTTLYLQEMTGIDAAVVLDFFNSEGRAAAPARAYTVTRYSTLELPDAIPAGTTTLRVKNNTAGATISGYGLIADTETSDLFTIVQLPPGTGDLFCPAFVDESGGGREIYIHLANASAEPITVSANRSVVQSGRRRSVASGPGSAPPAAPATVTIPGFGSRQLFVTGNGPVRIMGPSALRAAATATFPRSAAAAAGGDTGRVGSGLAIIPASRALTASTAGGLRFAGFEDSSAATVAAARPLTFRSRLMIFEVSGRDTRVHVTLRYAIPGGTGGNTAAHSKDYLIPANTGYSFYPLAEEIIGVPREALGDLHDASVTVEVVNTATPGTVIVFLQMIDNGTGDVTVRYQ